MGWGYGYGYQFWQGPGNTFLAFGAFGQLIICDPAKNMFVATTAGCSEQENRCLLGIIYETIISTTLDQPIPRQNAVYETLTKRISTLCLPFAEGKAISNLEEQYFSKKYIFVENNYKISDIVFVRKCDNEIQVQMRFVGNNIIVNAGYRKWVTNEAYLDTSMHTLHSFSYAWKNVNVLVLIQYMINTSYSKFYEFKFNSDGVKLSVSQNERLCDDQPWVILGRAQ